MALQLGFTAYTSDDCKNIQFIETTGAYSSTNTGGYGAPNPLVTDYDTATLTITDPGGTTYTAINLFTSNFPTMLDTVIFTVTNTDIGLAVGDKITDGLWTFKYLIDDSTSLTDVHKELTQQFLFTCAAKCCVQKMLAKVEITDCCNSKLDEVVKASTYLSAAIQAALCGKPNQASALLEQVNFLCNKNNCNCS